jgi:peptidoglycan-associated lipoprotein
MTRTTTKTTTLLTKQLIPLLCAALIAFAAGCASNDIPVEEPVDTSEFEEAPAPPPQPTVSDTSIANRNLSIAPVYFDLDESSIKPEFESILQSAAGALRDSGASVTIEGHCDERGSDEYNIALGERRANAVRSYLYNLGVPNGQMTVVSFGEARPAVNGAGETAFQLNRRAEFSTR